MDWETGIAAIDFTNYISVNRTLIARYGLHAAVLIGELASEARYWTKNGRLDDGWFFSTMENVESATGLSEHFQRQAVKCLVDAGLIEVEYKGLPRKRYFRVDGMAVIRAMKDDVLPDNSQKSTTCTTSDGPREPLSVDHVDHNNNKEQLEITELKKEGKPKKPRETYDSIVSEFTDDPELRESILGFIAMRKMKRAVMTNRALKMKLKRVSGFTSDPKEQAAIFDQSTSNGWTDIYELKDRPKRLKEAAVNDSTRAGLEARGFYGDGTSWRPEDFYEC